MTDKLIEQLREVIRVEQIIKSLPDYKAMVLVPGFMTMVAELDKSTLLERLEAAERVIEEQANIDFDDGGLSAREYLAKYKGE